MERRPITFGTDGIRGVANRALTPDVALRLGLAGARAFGGPILIGRDTRLSGGMLSGALAAGTASGGAKVVDLGVLPTPGVAALAPKLGASAAAVVSASHNPYPDNGIKFFSGEGRKLSEAKEREVELLTAEEFERPIGDGIGAVELMTDAAAMYVDDVLDRLRPSAEGVRVMLDCANGAAYEAAPMAFGELGADLTLSGVQPTGTNINEGCGSTHVEELDATG
ncbi:MAG TPA: phosphoglucosamine mutase, partial [Rubrobacteraceae bacterium]|nr:phosphoglucosamine mutase [Rubrobacteraceae bacterium]